MENTQQDRENEVKRIFTNTAKSYEYIVNATTLGMDKMWKKRMIEICGEKYYGDKTYPSRILDLACGTGMVTFGLAKLYPQADIVGLDIMQEYLDIAQYRLDELSVKGDYQYYYAEHPRTLKDRIRFVKMNADELEYSGTDFAYLPFDLIISSYIPKYIDFPKLLRNCDKLLAPGGLMLFHDFTRPRRLVYRSFYNLYWYGLSRMLYFSPGWREMGKDLKNIIWRSEWVSQFNAVTSASLHYIDRETEWQPFDIACIVCATKPDGDKEDMLSGILPGCY